MCQIRYTFKHLEGFEKHISQNPWWS